jgi:GNAT superfamily N-acetyltransferase
MIDVFETRDTGLLRGLLESDRVAGAYLLGDLEAPFFEQGRWFVAAWDGSPLAVVLLFQALADPVMLSFGDGRGVASILGFGAGWRAGGPTLTEGPSDGWPFPMTCYLKVPPEHEEAFSATFEIVQRETMKVMWLEPGGATRPGEYHIRRLTADSPIDQILDVYRSYPGHFFEPGQLTSGIYFGSFEGDRLVAVAGTHVYSPAGRVAAVGNIVTAVEARGRGHAGACTAAVIDALRARGCDTIVLHVAESNAPAQACYRRLGFVEYGPILQLEARYRSTVC